MMFKFGGLFTIALSIILAMTSMFHDQGELPISAYRFPLLLGIELTLFSLGSFVLASRNVSFSRISLLPVVGMYFLALVANAVLVIFGSDLF